MADINELAYNSYQYALYFCSELLIQMSCKRFALGIFEKKTA